MNVSLKRIKKWSMMGGVALFDQGVFSGSNFITNILLARWLLPDEYGAYTIGLAASIFFLQLLMSYMLEPMSVLGPSSYEDSLQDYLTAQVRLYFLMMIPLSLLFTIASYIYMKLGGNSILANVLMAMGLMLSLTILPWLLRRVFYVVGRPETAAKGSMIYAVLLISFVFFAKKLGVLTGITSVYAVAFSGLGCSIFLISQLNYRFIKKNKVLLIKVLLENWTFGKWLLASGLLITIGGQAQIFLSGSLLSVRDAGVVYATQALSQPMILCITAINSLITPSLAADFAKGELASFKQKAFLVTVILTLLAIVFELFLVLFKGPLEMIVYGGRFSSNVLLIPLWGLTPLIMSIVSGMQCSLQAAKRPYAILIAALFWVPVTLGLGVVLTTYWGLWGIAVSTIIGYLVLALVIGLLYRKWLLYSLVPIKIE